MVFGWRGLPRRRPPRRRSNALDQAERRELLAFFWPESNSWQRCEIVELGAGITLFVGFSKIAVALGGLPDEIPVHEQPTPEVPAGG